MRNEPFAAILNEEHSEPRRSWYRLTVLQTSKIVKASNYYGVVIEHHLCAARQWRSYSHFLLDLRNKPGSVQFSGKQVPLC